MAADDFDAGFSVMRVSAVSDHNAMYGTDIDVTLTFGAQVDGTAATGGPTLTIFVEDKFGAQTSVTAPTITAKDLNSLEMVSKTIIKPLHLPFRQLPLTRMT